jgi:hypothetical protein
MQYVVDAIKQIAIKNGRSEDEAAFWEDALEIFFVQVRRSYDDDLSGTAE